MLRTALVVGAGMPAGLRADPAAILEHMSPRFDETFRAVTAGTTDMRVDELSDRDPLPFWGKGLSHCSGTRRTRCCRIPARARPRRWSMRWRSGRR